MKGTTMMNCLARSVRFGAFATAGLLLSAGTSVAQGGEDPTDPLALGDELIVLDYSVGPVDPPPSFEMLSDNRAAFTVHAGGSVSGDLEGTITSNIHQVVEDPPSGPPTDSGAATFTIETADGTIEGYYVVTLHGSAGDSAATVNAHGQILAVTGAYADLFLAEVYVTGEVPLDPEGVGTGENGAMTIAPRRT